MKKHTISISDFHYSPSVILANCSTKSLVASIRLKSNTVEYILTHKSDGDQETYYSFRQAVNRYNNA